MTPIFFQEALFHVGLARLELGFSLFGAAGLAFQFAHAGGRSVACFSALLALAYAILLLNLVRSIRTARRKRDALYTLWPVLWLGVTLIDGLRLTWGIVPNEKALFAHHLTAGLLGTMTALIGLLSPWLLSGTKEVPLFLAAVLFHLIAFGTAPLDLDTLFGLPM